MPGYGAAEVRHGMRTVDRDRFWRLCGRKFRYSSRREATEAIAELVPSGQLRAYYCEYCAGYHIGHPRKETGTYDDER